MTIPDFTISKWFGLNTNIKDLKTLKAGISPDSLNWITAGKEGDHIELRRGQKLLGTTRNEVEGGKISGIGTALRYDGVEVPFFAYGRKVKYYDVDTDDVIEVGTDMLPETASSDDVWFQPYQSLAGSFIYLGSPNSGVYKIPSANPGNAIDQQVNNYRFGVFHIGQSRAFAGQRNGTTAGNQDKTGLYLSYIDKAQLSDYTQVIGESFGTGDGTTITFVHTMTDITAPKTAMYPSVTDGTETFTDDRNGNMIGNLGGTGTVNYATGVVSVTFATAPVVAAPITCSYYHETSTSTGILDFSGGESAQGKSFRQDNGGNFMAVFNLNLIEYCFHLLKTWQFSGQLDDSQSTNLPYRDIGIPYPRAAFQTPEGIIFADLARPNDPKFRRLEVLAGTSNTTIEPKSISDALDLSGHSFDYCVAFRWGDYEIFCVQERTNSVANTYNSIMYVRNVLSGAYDRLDYYASCLSEYGGTLIAGDSLSNNVFTLFSGFDDDGEVIRNYYTTSDLNLKYDGLKICHRMVIDGLIQKEQSYKVQLSLDGGPYSDYYTISGNGVYVDSGISVSVGGTVIGSHAIGGSASSSDGGNESAHPYEIDFPIHTDKFVNIRVRLEALGIGYVSVNSITFKDIRDKGRKNISSHTVV
jgi:hypothetical protein